MSKFSVLSSPADVFRWINFPPSSLPPYPTVDSFNSLGVKLSNPDDADSIEKLALVMFDTRTIKGLDFNPFSENNVLKLNAVQEYPQDLYFILRTVLMFRGMAQASLVVVCVCLS